MSITRVHPHLKSPQASSGVFQFLNRCPDNKPQSRLKNGRPFASYSLAASMTVRLPMSTHFSLTSRKSKLNFENCEEMSVPVKA